MGGLIFARGLKANFGYNTLGALVPVFLAIVTLPLYVATIGAARYGVLSLIWVTLGLFGYLDFGLSRASANALAKLDRDATEERGSVIRSAFLANLVLGAAAGVLLWVAGKLLLDRVVPLAAGLRGEADAILPLVALMLPMAMVTSVAEGVFEARERFLIVNVFQTLSSTSAQIVPVVCALAVAPTLPVVLSATLAPRMLLGGVLIGLVGRTERVDWLRGIDYTFVKQFFRYGRWVTVSNTLNISFGFIDRYFIGAALGAAAVAYYSVPMNVVSRTQMMATALARALLPRFSRSRPEEANELAERAVGVLSYATAIVYVPLLVLAKPLMTLWMGQHFATLSTSVAEILLVGTFINAMAFVPSALLMGQGRPDVVARLHLIQLVPFALLLWTMIAHFGLVGAALAWTVRVLVDAAALFVVTGLHLRCARALALPTMLVLASFSAGLVLSPGPAAWLTAVVLTAVGVGMGLCANPTFRALAGSGFRLLRRSAGSTLSPRPKS